MNENEIKEKAGEEQPENSNLDYIKTIKEIKENSVSKEEYKKVLAENKQLLNAIVKGEGTVAVEEKEEEVSIDDIRKKLFSENNGNVSNLEFITNALKLREKRILEDKVDPWVADNPRNPAQPGDYETAARIANVLQDLVNDAEGDADAFQASFIKILR